MKSFFSGSSSNNGESSKEKGKKPSLTSFELILAAANAGNPLAQAEIGRRYRIGWEVKENIQQAFFWSKKSAEQGHPYGYYQLSLFYNEGSEAFPRNERLFHSYTQKAINQIAILKSPEAQSKNTNCSLELNAASWYAAASLYKEGYGELLPKSYKTAEYYYKKSAEVNDPEALQNLALLYNSWNLYVYIQKKRSSFPMHESLVPFNMEDIHWESIADERSKQLILKSIELGNLYSEYLLAVFYAGAGLTDDYLFIFENDKKRSTKAVDFAKKAAKHGSIDALALLGLMHINAYRKDGYGNISHRGALKEGMRLLHDAADKGSWSASNILIDIYQLGRWGIPKDEKQAYQLLKQAAENGNVKAQYRFGKRLEEPFNKNPHHIDWLHDQPTNEIPAIQCYKKAAKKGDIASLDALIELYQKIETLIRIIQKKHLSDPEAGYWYKLAVEQQRSNAATGLLELYEANQGGLSKTDSDAGKWYELILCREKAASKNNFWVSLAQMYEKGTGGLSQNNNKAFECYKIAADNGASEIQYLVGEYYSKGNLSQSINLELSEEYYKKAFVSGCQKAKEPLAQFYLNKGQRDETQNPIRAANLYKEALKLDCVEARQRLIRLHEKDNAKIDIKEAAEWYKAEARVGNRRCLDIVVKLYSDNILEDKVEAMEWYLFAAQQEHKEAQYLLGCIAEQGLFGLERDEQKAILFYQRAANAGEKNAQLKLTQLSEQGHLLATQALNNLGFSSYQLHVPAPLPPPIAIQTPTISSTKIMLMGFEETQKLAIIGDARAQYQMGRFYRIGERECIRNETIALEWYKKSRDQGNGCAEWALGYINEQGLCGLKPDKMKAIQHYQKALKIFLLNTEDVFIQTHLGFMHAYAQGVPQNEPLAIEYFYKAAEQGYALAQNVLGTLYEQGKGVSKDERQAVKLYRQAAKQNFSAAERNLGRMYEQGKGVIQDEKQAIELYRKAAEQNDEDAINDLNRLQSKLKPLASGFRPN